MTYTSLVKLVTRVALLSTLAIAPIAAQAQLKVGVVNAARLLEESRESKSALKKLENDFKSRERKLEAQKSQLEKTGEKLSRDAAVMGEEERLRKFRDFEDSRIQLAKSAKEFQEDLGRSRQRELMKLQESMNVVIRQVALEGGYDLILSEGVVYANERVDLTDLILNRLGR